MINRFKTMLEQLKLSPSEFADRIGVQRSSVSHVLSGRNKPGLDFLEKILNTFPEVDVNWLITGKLDQPLQQKQDLFDEGKEVNMANTKIEDEDMAPYGNRKPLPGMGEAVDHIIIVYKNNTFRLLHQA